MEAEKQFPPHERTALLALLDQGVPFKNAVAKVGVRAHQVWGVFGIDGGLTVSGYGVLIA